MTDKQKQIPSSIKRWINPHFIGSFSQANTLPIIRNIGGLPLPEIAIVGRSNVGKSSLINSLMNWKHAARVSKTPGKTVLINLFKVDNWLSVADLPGYGYAKVALEEKKLWEKELPLYLKSREQLKGLVILVDLRRTIEVEELSLVRSLFESEHITTCLFIGTKADKFSSHDFEIATRSFSQAVENISMQNPRSDLQIISHITSSTKGTGINQLKKIISSIFSPS